MIVFKVQIKSANGQRVLLASCHTLHISIIHTFKKLFSHILHPDLSFPFSKSLLPTSTLPKIHCSSLSLQKRAGLPGISTEHGITGYNNTRHNPSYQVWTKQINRRKGVPRAGKRVRDSPCSHCQKSPKSTKLYIHNMNAEDLAQSHAGSRTVSSVSVSPSEPCLIDSVGCAFVDSGILID